MTLPDGFVAVDPTELRDLAKNAGATVDEFSLFARRREIRRRDESLMIDRHYGLSYHTMALRPAAIYGPADDLPPYSGDELSNAGFLRVPFRRIPRRIVRTRAEIEELLSRILSGDPNLNMLFRGQTREHLITRSPSTTQWLYGADSVMEPSLTTSASRRSPALEDVLPEWGAFLRLFADVLDMGRPWWLRSSLFPLSALALAQHYGLPTSGLDVTNRLDVALFFALMDYKKSPDSYRATYTPTNFSAGMPVIYLLFPAQQQQFDYESYRGENFPHGRPDAQSAHFMHMGWGLANNRCAERIFLALYLDPKGDYGSFPSAAKLFPADEADRFAMFMEQNAAGLPGALARVVKEGFYTIDS